ncbi:MAG: gliding motility lipoprotein GldH [Ferruginibacter sp.]
MIRIIIFAFFISTLFSCRQIDVYEKNTPIPKYEWNNSFAAKGSFIISDTTSLYNIYVTLRHTDAYAYNNIWLQIGLKNPGDTLRYQRVDLSLGNDQNGWEGTGMNDIWDVRKKLNDQALQFKKPGEYSFEIRQVMRDEPLKNIISAGMRIEKIVN